MYFVFALCYLKLILYFGGNLIYLTDKFLCGFVNEFFKLGRITFVVKFSIKFLYVSKCLNGGFNHYFRDTNQFIPTESSIPYYLSCVCSSNPSLIQFLHSISNFMNFRRLIFLWSIADAKNSFPNIHALDVILVIVPFHVTR